MFINLMEITKLIDCVIDDNPLKRGLQMPGSRLPIVGSEVLGSGQIRLCLSSLSAESERNVIAKQDRFVKGGGSFASIFPTRADCLLHFVAGPTTPEEALKPASYKG
jgi:hypothetical protein